MANTGTPLHTSREMRAAEKRSNDLFMTIYFRLGLPIAPNLYEQIDPLKQDIPYPSEDKKQDFKGNGRDSSAASFMCLASNTHDTRNQL